jgi:hypothetical protein
MLEALVISLMVGVAAAHVAFKLAPKPTQQKFRGVMAASLNKIGLAKVAQRLVNIPQASDKACGSGCNRCGAEAPAGREVKDQVKDGGAKVVQFHPRIR